MKKSVRFFSIFWMLTLVFYAQVFMAQSQRFSYQDSWGTQGMNLMKQDNHNVKLNISLQDFSLNPETIDGLKMNAITMKGAFLPGDEGAPDMPVFSRYVAVPRGATVKVNVLNERVEQFENMEIAPAPRIPKDNEQGPLHYEKNPAIYSKDAFYPQDFVMVSEPMKIRGVDVVIVAVSPFQYNPVTKKLIVHRDVKLEVSFEGGTGHFGEDRLRNRWWEPILRDMVINEASIPELPKTRTFTNNGREDEGCDYLIITPDDATFKAWADSIRVFRTKQGILTKVVTTTDVGGNTTSAIEQYVNDAYNNWAIPPAAVLLMADYGTSGNTIISPTYNNYCASDNIYADVDGDQLPDVVFARMTAQNEGHLQTMVTKVLNYERTPPTNPDFYAHPITAMGWQTERWFQLCSEIVAGFLENELGKSVSRENAIYSGNPDGGVWSTATNTATILDVFGEDGLGYIPDSPDYLDDWGGNASRINEDINNGAFILQHRDHGYEQGWGEPAYSSSDIDGLTNEDLTFVFSVNCLTGRFDYSSECFAEKFHRSQYGALGIIAATQVSYSFVNDTYVWGMYDNMWPDFLPDYGTNPEARGVIPAFANAAGKYFLEQSNWPYNGNNKEVTYHLFHDHGDAFSTVYYEVPQYLSVDHDEVLLSGLDYFTVKANEGALICLSIGDQILATAEATGNEQEIAIPPQDPGIYIDIVITLQNYYRYQNQIEVIPPEGAYCMYDDHTINDTCGNGNNKPEFNENILINLSMKNLGIEDAANVMVTLSSQDSYIEFMDDSEDYDSILAGQTVNRDLAYKFHITDDVPDQHQAKIDITATDANDSTWNSKFFMVVSAPKLSLGNMIIDDSELGNDNGRLDPGETAIMKIATSNKGHCVAYNVVCTLTSYNQFITVEEEEQTIPMLSLFGAAYPEYTVTVSDDAPDGIIAQMHYHVTTAGYSETKNYYPKIGLFLEDWETGNFDKYNWVQGGDLPWQITMEYPYQGYFHVRSGEISDNQTSELSISYEVMSDDNIRFYKKVSSEIDFDKLKFYIDGQLRGTWSGTSTGWTQESFPVAPGNHTFLWVYQKDYATSEGADCAWLDYIELPTMLVTTLFAGPDDGVCEGLSYQCIGTATNQDSVFWSTSGDGTFSNENILTPIYTPGENDIQNGEVVLTMGIIDVDGNEYSDDMTLTILFAPDPPEMPAGPDYIDVYKDTETEYAIASVEGATDYEWLLDPEEAGTVFGIDTTAIIYWNENYLGDATLQAKALNNCGEGEYSEPLPIFVDNTVDVFSTRDDVRMSVAPNPNKGSFRILIKTDSDKPVSVKLFNSMGLEMFRLENINANNGFVYDYSRTGLAEGVYILIMEQGGEYFSRKIVVF